MPLLLLALGCPSSAPDTGFITVDTAYAGYPELLEATSACGPDGSLLVQARTLGWSSSGLVQVWDPSGGYAYFFTHTIAFTQDETCDIVEGTSADDLASSDVYEPIATCTGDPANQYTVLVEIWYERGCAGVLAWGPQEQAVYDGTIVPPPIQVVEDGVVDEDCAALLDQTDKPDPGYVPTPLTCN